MQKQFPSKRRRRPHGPKAKLLFRETFGTVTVTIYGPPIGWEWIKTHYFRFVPSTTKPGAFERRAPDREVDQPHLLKAVDAVNNWLRDREASRQAIYKPKC